jgi:hypothetical protein
MMQIIDTTDGRYKGMMFRDGDNPIHLAMDVDFRYERAVQLPGGIKRYISTSYVLDAKGV